MINDKIILIMLTDEKQKNFLQLHNLFDRLIQFIQSVQLGKNEEFLVTSTPNEEHIFLQAILSQPEKLNYNDWNEDWLKRICKWINREFAGRLHFHPDKHSDDEGRRKLATEWFALGQKIIDLMKVCIQELTIILTASTSVNMAPANIVSAGEREEKKVSVDSKENKENLSQTSVDAVRIVSNFQNWLRKNKYKPGETNRIISTIKMIIMEEEKMSINISIDRIIEVLKKEEKEGEEIILLLKAWKNGQDLHSDHKDASASVAKKKRKHSSGTEKEKDKSANIAAIKRKRIIDNDDLETIFCQGCEQEKPYNKFPVENEKNTGLRVRYDECRTCRDDRRLGHKEYETRSKKRGRQ